MSEKRTNKRITVPQKRAQVSESNTILMPSARNLLDDALSIIGNDLVRYKFKTNKGHTLDLAEARVIQGHIKALVELSKEDRERSRSEDLNDLSNEQILEYMLDSLPREDVVKMLQNLIRSKENDNG